MQLSFKINDPLVKLNQLVFFLLHQLVLLLQWFMNLFVFLDGSGNLFQKLLNLFCKLAVGLLQSIDFGSHLILCWLAQRYCFCELLVLVAQFKLQFGNLLFLFFILPIKVTAVSLLLGSVVNYLLVLIFQLFQLSLQPINYQLLLGQHLLYNFLFNDFLVSGLRKFLVLLLHQGEILVELFKKKFCLPEFFFALLSCRQLLVQFLLESAVLGLKVLYFVYGLG